MECFLRALQEEMEQGRFSQLILVTATKDETLPVLISSLSKYSLLHDFNKIVAGVASLEDIATAVNPELNLRTLEDCNDYYQQVLNNKRLDLSKPQLVPAQGLLVTKYTATPGRRPGRLAAAVCLEGARILGHTQCE